MGRGGSKGYVVEGPAANSSMGVRNIVVYILFFISLSYLLYSSHLLAASRKSCDPQHISRALSNSSGNASASHNISATAVQKSYKLTSEQHHQALNTTTLQIPENQRVMKPKPMKPEPEETGPTDLSHIVFGIAASADLWHTRKEYIKQWWRPKSTRGIVWLDKPVRTSRGEGLPEIRISGDTSKLPYKHPFGGSRSALRISRIVSETLRLKPKDVRWIVMGDDDTVFIVENVVRVLQKFDHRQYYYIGSPSESHIQNLLFSYHMAYGGGGFAISYPLAVELEKMQDGCIERYAYLYGSDDRIHACMSELGVPLTKHPGFHQFDVYGELLGLLAAHPVAPLVSLHHLDLVEPVFPETSRPEAIHRLFNSVNKDSASIMQQSICYNKKQKWSISVSWGYVVQITRGLLSPRELEMPARTFLNWHKRANYFAYSFNTRPVTRNPCQKPFTYYFSDIRFDNNTNQTVSRYSLHGRNFPSCRWKKKNPDTIRNIVVFKKPDPLRWEKSPRRDCCRVLPSGKGSTMHVSVGNCADGEFSEV